MADVFSKRKRSEVMSRIRSQGNRDTELTLVRLLRLHKITGWRRQQTLIVCSSEREFAHSSALRLRPSPQRPVIADSRRLLRVKVDFVFRNERVAVFVDGCFWHACPQHATQPKGNAAFWRKKLAANKARDRRVNRALRKAGWRVVRIWEHALKPRNAHEGRLVRRIQRMLEA